MIALAALLAMAVEPTVPTAPTAPADVALRILVVPKQGEDAARVEEIYGGLRAAGLLPVELDERAGVDRAGLPPPPAGIHDAVRAHLLEARAAFRGLDLDATRAAADAAVDEALRMERPEDAKDDVVDALLLKANAALQSGADDDARAALTLVSRLDPARNELHPGLYPPSLCDAYTAARAAAAEATLSTVVVRPRVAGFHAAELVVDGAAMPVGAHELGAGPHVVTVRAAGMVPFSRLLVLDAHETRVLAPFLAPPDAVARRTALVAAARGAVDDAARTTALAALAELCAARAALFVAGDEATLWSARGLTPLAVPSTVTGAALGRATLAGLQRKDEAAAEFPVVPVVVAASAGVVVLAGAVVLGVYALSPAQPPAQIPRPVSAPLGGF